MRPNVALPTVVLAVTLVLVGCGDQSAEDQSGPGREPTASMPSSSAIATSSTGPAAEIPDDFPLTSGLGEDPRILRAGDGLDEQYFCGTSPEPTPLRGLEIRDRMIAQGGGGRRTSTSDTRELVLLDNPEEPRQAARAFTDQALECAGPDGVRLSGGDWTDMSVRIEIRESALGPSPATTMVKTYSSVDQRFFGTLVTQVVPVGNALLVSVSYGEWLAADLEAGIGATVNALSGAVDAMAMFSDGTAPSPSVSPTSPPEAAVIPDDFPLDASMVEGDADNNRHGPTRDGDGAGEVEMCGRVVWPDADAQDRLVTPVGGPEYYDARELLVFADSDAALAVMAPIRQAAKDCRGIDNQVWTPLEEDTGWDSVTMGLSYDDGLGSSVFQFTRVGSAVLFVTSYGEGSLQSLPDQGSGVTDVTTAIAPAMCAFTAAGC